MRCCEIFSLPRACHFASQYSGRIWTSKENSAFSSGGVVRRSTFQGEIQGIDIQLFQLRRRIRTQSSEGPKSHDETQTVLLLPIPEDKAVSVQFTLKGWGPFLTNVDGIEFRNDDIFSADEDKALLEEFNDRYFVSPPEHARDNVDVTQEIGRIMSLPFVRQIMAGPKWNIEIGESHMAVWIPRKVMTAANIVEYLNHASALHDALLTESGRPAKPLTVTSDLDQPVTLNIVPIAVSGCLGIFVAFGMFIPVFFLFVEEAPWIVFVWPFFGMAVVAAFVFTGTKIAKSREQKKKREAEDLGSGPTF